MKSMLIDLSHTVEAGVVTYKGLPAPIICDYLSREASRISTWMRISLGPPSTVSLEIPCR